MNYSIEISVASSAQNRRGNRTNYTNISPPFDIPNHKLQRSRLLPAMSIEKGEIRISGVRVEPPLRERERERESGSSVMPSALSFLLPPPDIACMALLKEVL